MTLSHCWGAVVPKKLTTDNYLSMLEGIALSDLPATFLEAIQLTRRLGLRYLWIDSLCIIQDSSEDWGTESVRMFDIYRNSYLNIGAAGASDANGGLFSALDSGKAPPCVLTIGTGENSRHIASEYEPKISLYRDEQCPLFGRAWVFQELLLAPALCSLAKMSSFGNAEGFVAPKQFQNKQNITQAMTASGWLPVSCGKTLTIKTINLASEYGLSSFANTLTNN